MLKGNKIRVENFYPWSAKFLVFFSFNKEDSLIINSGANTLVSKSVTGRLLSISCNKSVVAILPISIAGCFMMESGGSISSVKSELEKPIRPISSGIFIFFAF